MTRRVVREKPDSFVEKEARPSFVVFMRVPSNINMSSELRRSLLVLLPDSCEGCGLCCEGIGSPVVLYASRPGLGDLHPFRPADLPFELIEEIDLHFSGLTRGQEPQEKCLWFDAERRMCRHYDYRPQVCRDYELGGHACLLRRRDELTGPSPD